VANTFNYSVLLDPIIYPYEEIAKTEGYFILRNKAEQVGWKNFKFGFIKDEPTKMWRAYIWQ